MSMNTSETSSAVLGGPYNGFSARQTINNYKTAEETMSRRVVRDAWNTKHTATSLNGHGRKATPFRAVNSADDYLSRENYTCGGSTLTNASKPGLKSRIGSIISSCDTTGVAGSTTNPKFVADSSDYIKYKKQVSTNNNYNDLANGGDESNGSYSFLMRVR